MRTVRKCCRQTLESGVRVGADRDRYTQRQRKKVVVGVGRGRLRLPET